MAQWLATFGREVPRAVMRAHVTGGRNCMWHIFTWGQVPCVTGDAARQRFDALPCTPVLQFREGARHVETVGKPLATDLEMETGVSTDVYIVDADFTWTFVHTHEDECGPYFCAGFKVMKGHTCIR